MKKFEKNSDEMILIRIIDNYYMVSCSNEMLKSRKGVYYEFRFTRILHHLS